MEIALVALVIVLFISLAACVFVIKSKNDKLQRMLRIYEVGRKITSNIKFKPLMKEIMETVKKEADAEACSLYLIDKEKGELWFEIALGDKGDKVKEIRLKIGEGVAGWVAREGVTLNLKDVNKDPRFKREIGEKIEFKQKAMLTMPVKFKDETIGVLQLINKNGGGFFTSSDEELVEGISSQVAIALENAKLYKTMQDLFVDVISSLASAIDAKDPYTNGHSKRVTEYSMDIGREMGMNDEQLEKLQFTAVLHDVGKIGIIDSILNKQAPLSNEEFDIMKTHTTIGSKILESVRSLKDVVTGAKYHHEKFNGMGYPEGLKGEEIPVEARIISIADTYDAMTTDRPYRKGLSHTAAMEEIKRCSGTQLDPKLAEYFNAVMSRRTETDNEQ